MAFFTSLPKWIAITVFDGVHENINSLINYIDCIITMLLNEPQQLLYLINRYITHLDILINNNTYIKNTQIHIIYLFILIYLFKYILVIQVILLTMSHIYGCYNKALIL